MLPDRLQNPANIARFAMEMPAVAANRGRGIRPVRISDQFQLGDIGVQQTWPQLNHRQHLID
jgi:hypothetical protein